MFDIYFFQFFGLAMFPIGVGMLVHPEMLAKMFRNLEHDPVAVYLSGFMSLFIGYLLVAFHNVWSFDRTVIITIIGWLALLKGFSLLLFPTSLFSVSKKLTKSDAFQNVFPWYAIVFGIILLFFGFFA